MKPIVLLACLVTVLLCGCSWIPRAGPSASEVVEQGRAGDTISVLIWESAAGGLFSEAPPATLPTGSRPATEPLAPEARPPTSQRPSDLGAPGLSIPQQPGGAKPEQGQRPGGNPPRGEALSIAANAASSGRQA